MISIGVTADSYIVFFERLKDELRGGRSPRSVVQPAFKKAFRTIVAADVVTFIAAAVLYVTAASARSAGSPSRSASRRSLDLFVVYFFKRPTVFLLARNRAPGGDAGVRSEGRRGGRPRGHRHRRGTPA